jgi:D-alanyl-D-alanine carboxypeptidase
MANELICKIVSSPRYKANFKTFKEKKIICKPIVWVNTNKLLERNNSVVGIKTGITPKAGGCLATFYKIDEKNFAYIVVLGSSTTEARFKDTQIIIDYITD